MTSPTAKQVKKALGELQFQVSSLCGDGRDILFGSDEAPEETEWRLTAKVLLVEIETAQRRLRTMESELSSTIERLDRQAEVQADHSSDGCNPIR